MANPIKGRRIPVKLPWKGATDNSEQFVSMKEPVAKLLGFTKATQAELLYTTKVNKKDKSPKPADNDNTKVTVKRRRRPGYRQRSIIMTFQIGRIGKTTGAKKAIAGESYASVQFPITKSVAIADVIEFFEAGGAGASLKVLKITDANTGQSYPIV
jgi:hypothetical protein